MTSNSKQDGSITALLAQYNAGDPEAMNQLLSLVYDELCNVAHRYLARERHNHTLDTRALVHEAYIRLVGGAEIMWQNRKHFYVIAARAMRRVLCDYARKEQRAKRGGGKSNFSVTSFSNMFDEKAPDVEDHAALILSIDQAMNKLEIRDPDLARLVELRFFHGFTIKETADVLGSSPRTVNRAWHLARGYLSQLLKELSP